jgi:asparagine synthase (glutamine-hydrolysing)
MCGIFAGYTPMVCFLEMGILQSEFDKIQYRGPDLTKFALDKNEHVALGFHRLAINGVGSTGDQPMTHPEDPDLVLVCNGEIYNHKQLIKENGFKTKSDSDCEVILHMYKKHGIRDTVKQLDGVFAFVIYDRKKDLMVAARDRFGVRPLFIGYESTFNRSCPTFLSSEAKAISDLSEYVTPFPPGTVWFSDEPYLFSAYYNCSYPVTVEGTEEEMCQNIRELLTKSVEKRMMSEREIGCLLSGGLDSSLISALVSKNMRANGKKLKTFSIGMEGSPDLEYAKKVAEHIGSDHHVVQLTSQEFLDAIETVIYNIESYDTTTVRASVGNYLVSKYIRANTNCKVVFNGDGADEVCMGYVYNQNAPSDEDFFYENIRLLREIHYFDVLRSDRSISSNGLEPRTPFLDKDFVEYYMNIEPEFKRFGKNGKPEKYLLRKAFEGTGLLPDEVLWRHKCAFSDGVSSIENSWHKTLKEFVDSQLSDEEFEEIKKKTEHCRPILKESAFYRKIYESYYGEHVGLIPHFWMPRWTDVVDPSARELSNYKE